MLLLLSKLIHHNSNWNQIRFNSTKYIYTIGVEENVVIIYGETDEDDDALIIYEQHVLYVTKNNVLFMNNIYCLYLDFI